jgi:hypothetical protein
MLLQKLQVKAYTLIKIEVAVSEFKGELRCL